MYKVFINNRPLYLLSEAGVESLSLNVNKISCNTAEIARTTVKQYLQSPPEKDIALIGTSEEALFEWCFGEMKKIEAAGGVVVNQKREALWIFRNGKWDIPKGKLDKGEDQETAALREVEEECGISGHQLRCPLPDSWHVYEHKGKWVIKVTYWYIMDYSGNQALIPQEEEGITKVEWRGKHEVGDILANTFNSIIDTWKEAEKQL